MTDLCHHCEIRPIWKGPYLCKVCFKKPSIRKTYRRRMLWDKNLEERIMRLRELVSLRAPLFNSPRATVEREIVGDIPTSLEEQKRKYLYPNYCLGPKRQD